MYPIHFYICLIASVGLVIGLVLLAIFPLRLPLFENIAKRQQINRQRKARSPTRHVINDWNEWDDDENDL